MNNVFLLIEYLVFLLQPFPKSTQALVHDIDFKIQSNYIGNFTRVFSPFIIDQNSRSKIYIKVSGGNWAILDQVLFLLIANNTLENSNELKNQYHWKQMKHTIAFNYAPSLLYVWNSYGRFPNSNYFCRFFFNFSWWHIYNIYIRISFGRNSA